MNNPIKVTILMPIFKVEQYLEKTLDSVFSQSYSNITIVNHQQNEGIAVSRTDCIANAKGDYVFFVDSDDWIEKDAVTKMVEATQDGIIDIVGCDFLKDYISGDTTYHHENYAGTCRENLYRCLNYDIATVLWKLLIKRSLFDNFTITPHVDIVEDYIMSVKLYYYAKSFVAIPHAFYHYVQYNQARVSLQTLWSVNMHIKGVEEVEAFCRDKGLYDNDVEHKLLLRKFNIKSNFLTKQLLDYQSYRNTFPEAKAIWREMGYSGKEKIKFWLAEHGLYYLLKLIQR